MPALWGVSGTPEFVLDLAISKREVSVKLAANVSEQDVESLVIRKSSDG
jgi:hypothetical protein